MSRPSSLLVPLGTSLFLALTVSAASGASGASGASAAPGAPAVSPRPFTLPASLGNPDTGIRNSQCYGDAGDALVACASTPVGGQDGQGGRDTEPAVNASADGRLGFSFQRVCNSGEWAGTGTCPAVPVLGPGPDDWACTYDAVTGLMWEVKTADGFRARTHRYTNYSPDDDPVGQYGSATDASGYLQRVNSSFLCGHSDWGLTHISRLFTLLDFGVANPGARVDTGFLPGVYGGPTWSSSPNPHGLPTTAFTIDYRTGAVTNTTDRGQTLPVIAMVTLIGTGGPGHYRLSTDGTEVHDSANTAVLIWRRCVEGTRWDGTDCVGTPRLFTHAEALAWAAQQAAQTGLPWRVPTVKELNGITHRSLRTPVLDPTAFPGTPAAPHWSATPEVRDPARAWTTDFTAGQVQALPRAEAHVLRLARDEDGA